MQRLDEKLENLISRLLQIGVWGSLGLILVGTILGFTSGSYGHQADDLHRLIGPLGAFAHDPVALGRGIVTGNGPSLIVLGLVVLIATPVLRVMVSIVGFMLQRDRVFVLITAAVLALLALSFILGRMAEKPKRPPGNAHSAVSGGGGSI